MSVPTKTGREILDECLASVGKDIKEGLDTKYVELEDYQKEIELAVIKGFDLVEAYEKHIKREGWLSPEQIFEILQKEYNSGGITPVQLRILRDVFGVGGAKPK